MTGVHFALAVSGGEGAVADWLYTLVELGALGLAGWRAVAVRRDRLGWALMALGLALWTAGDLCWTLWLDHVENPPFPSVADGLYVGLYLAFYGGIAALLRNRIRPWPAWLVIDGLMAGLTLAALTAGVIFAPIRAATQGSTAVIVTTLVYPVFDLLLLVLVLVTFAACGWRPGRSWSLLGAGLAVCALADSFYVYQESTGTYLAGSWLDSMWPLSFTLIALAAWQPRPPASPAHIGWSVSSIPLVVLRHLDQRARPRRAGPRRRRCRSCWPAPRCSPGWPGRC